MRGCDGAFHAAGLYKLGLKSKKEIRRTNIEGTRNVLQLMKELAIPRGVYTSSLSIFSNTNGRLVDESYLYNGPHLTAYDATKWQAHYTVAKKMIDEGLPLVIVMPGAVYGKNNTGLLGRTLDLYLRGMLPFVPAGTASCWAHVDDTARAHILAMEKGRIGESYIIAGPRHTTGEVITILNKVSGRKPPAMQVPAWFFKLIVPALATLSRFITLPEIYSAEAVRLVAGVTYLGSNEKARAELGFNPRSLEQGLREVYGKG
jgi:nucleoside-diphosphate-sugar epimerase